jgi:hypothetical protein
VQTYSKPRTANLQQTYTQQEQNVLQTCSKYYDFFPQTSTMCPNIYNNTIVGVQLSLKLRDMLITERIILDDDT